MKANKLISAALSLCIAGAALPTEGILKNAHATFTWVDDYSVVISQHALDGELSYAAVHIDDNNIPEILVYDPAGTIAGGLYTFAGEKAVKLVDINADSEFVGYEESTGIFGIVDMTDTDEISSTHYKFYKLENSMLTVEADLRYDYWLKPAEDGSYPEECYLNGESISYDEYREIRNSYTDSFGHYPEYDYHEMHSLINDTLKLGLNEPENLDYTFSEEGTLLIKGTGDMPEFDWVSRGSGDVSVFVNWVDGMMPPWYYFRNLITKVIIGEGVTSISENAFVDCDRLESISIPSTVSVIGDSAFYHCDRLSLVRIPTGVSNVYSNTFSYCDGLTITEASTNVSSISYCAYERVPNLKYMVISNPQCEISQNGGTISNEWDINSTDSHSFSGTIIGYAGSTAQAYAESYNYNFKSIESIPFGDVNFDGKITASDAAAVLSGYADAASFGVSSLVPLQEKLGDMNYDGSITVTDAAKILGYYAYASTGGTGSLEEYLAQN